MYSENISHSYLFIVSIVAVISLFKKEKKPYFVVVQKFSIATIVQK